MPLSTHVATLGLAGAGGAADAGTLYFFKSMKGSYTSLKTETGIDEASEAQQDAPTYHIKDLLAKGILVRLAVYIKDGTKRKSKKIYVTRDKVSTALESLKGKAMGGGTVTSVTIPRSMTFY
ncbi:MAG TPA: hypothetical protein V6D48_24115 [Oculatellaceae cyanobacterium]